MGHAGGAAGAAAAAVRTGSSGKGRLIARDAEGRADAELLARVQAGDADAFRALVRRWYAQIHRWALAVTGEPDDAEDVVQAVLVKLHRFLGEYRGDAAFSTWLYRVTRNAAAEHARARARRAAIRERARLEHAAAGGASSGGDDVAERLARAQLARLVLDEHRRLPPRQREVFALADVHGHSPAEIAELLGIDRVTVRTNLLRARRAIRKRILDAHPELLEEYEE